MYNRYRRFPSPYGCKEPMYGENMRHVRYNDYGPEPFVVNIEKATMQNNNFRTTLWTGTHLQLTLMSINRGEDVGLEVQSPT